LAYLGESTDSRFSRTMIGLVNTILPRFDYFDWRLVIVDQLGLLSSDVVIKSIEYGLVYLAVVLALTVVVFNEKQF
jgi:hypothetical protein